MRHERIAVVGATGAVGREVLAVLAERGVEPVSIRALASERSAGCEVRCGRGTLVVEAVGPGSFGGVGVAIFAADAAAARALVPHALAAGATVVDNSSAYRHHAGVPLVIPEINGELLDTGPRLVASPNCSTVLLLAALDPLRRAFGVSAIDVATYQAVSGAGQAGMDELAAQAAAALRGRHTAARVFPEPCAFNVFSHDSGVDEATGVNGEERKIIDESRRIWGDPSLRITPTCVRVPVARAHTQAITVTLAEPAPESAVRRAFEGAAHLRLIDDRAANRFPTPLKAAGRDDVLVGRIRPDPGDPGAGGRHARWCLMACTDQLRKGAALNAVQIAERLTGGPWSPSAAGSPRSGRRSPTRCRTTTPP